MTKTFALLPSSTFKMKKQRSSFGRFFFFFLLSAFQCLVVYSQALKTIADIKTLNNVGVFGSVKLQGYIICDPAPLLISDINLYLSNTIIPEKDYILIQGKLANYIIENKEKIIGGKFEIIGRVSKNDTIKDYFHDTSGDHRIYLEADQIKLKLLEKSKFPNVKFGGIKVKAKIDLTSSAEKPECKKFALLYSGGGDWEFAYERFYNNLEFMYQTLKFRYGFSDDNIVVIYKDGHSFDDSIMHVDFPANEVGLDNAFLYLDTRMGKNGDLFVYTTNHGGGYNVKETKLQFGLEDFNKDEIDNYEIDETLLYYENDPNLLSDDLFNEKIASLHLKTLIAVFQQCFGGGFLRDLRSPNTCLLSASNEFELAYASTRNTFFDEFSHLFIAALNEAFEDGTGINDVDLNGDGIISIYEAYFYAKKKDNRDEHPMIDDNGDGVSDSQDGFYAKGLSLLSCDGFRIDKIKR